MKSFLPKQSILIVDDVPANIKLLNLTLKSDFEISACTSGKEALEIARSDDPPGLILLDIMMPEMDGYEVCRNLKSHEKTKDIPVIFITSKSEEHDETLGFELGAVDYITKPFRPAIVKARVNTHLDLKLHRDNLQHLVEKRTRKISETNEQLKWEIKEKVRAQEALRRSHDELEERVKERTKDLTLANLKLQEENEKQQISIDIAKKMLFMINGAPPANIALSKERMLCVSAFTLPCNMEGGDHLFVRKTEGGTSKTFGKTVISLKDQSGHEVGCILRSILTDLLHNELLNLNPDLPVEQGIARLNEKVMNSGIMDGDDFFTGIFGEIDNRTLLFRYVSAGHPPFLLIRGKNVFLYPDETGKGSNLPMALTCGISFNAGEITLQTRDKLLFYTDGLTEMPLAKKGKMISKEELAEIAKTICNSKEHEPFLVEIIEDIISVIAEKSEESVLLDDPEKGRTNTSSDDISFLGIEVEDDSLYQKFSIRAMDPKALSEQINTLYEKIVHLWYIHGYGEPENRLRMVLEEAVINAWKHGNQCDPEKAVEVFWRCGNDFHLCIVDQGKGFDITRIPDPTLHENRIKQNGRGVFIIRYLAEKAVWDKDGTRLCLLFRKKWSKTDHPSSRRQNIIHMLKNMVFAKQKDNHMEILVFQDDDKARFEIRGKIDEKGADELKSRFRELNTSRMSEVVFDFKNVSHIGSAGIGKLLLFYKDMATHGGKISVINTSSSVHELFKVLRLDSIFTVQPA